MNHPLRAAALLLALGLTACKGSNPDQPSSRSQPKGPIRVYVGTYTGKQSKGIYVMELDPKTGSLSEPRLAAESTSPSFLAVHPSKNFLYAVNEVPEFQGQKTGSVSAFAINDDGALTPLNQQSSGGAGPCHLDLDRNGQCVLVANYAGGSVALLPVDGDGSLKPPSSVIQHQGSSVNKQRQEAPHAHCINVVPDSVRRNPPGGLALVADLGLDKVLAYQFTLPARTDGTLAPANPPSVATAPGAGPRHLAFSPGGRFVYVNNELTSSVTAYSCGKGGVKEMQTLSTLPEGYEGKGNSTAEIAVHPTGKFVYVSNRGHDSIAIFRADEKTGQLTAAGHESTGGKTPRNFAIAPGGKYLLAANQNSDSVVVFSIDQETGDLTPTGTTVLVPTPVCVVFVTH